MADPEPYVPEDRALPLDEVELHRPEELEEPPAEKPPELSLESSRRRKLRRSLRSRKDSERRFGTARLRAVPDPKKRLIWIAVVMAVGLAGAAWWFIH